MKKKFIIKSRDSKYWFWVFVYDQLKVMRKDVVEHDEKTGQLTDDSYKVLGVCEPYERLSIEADGSETRYGNIGIIRLSKKYLSTEIVTHEVLHAAIWNYRIEHKVANFGKENSDKEEELVHLFGQLFASMNRKLHDKEFWI